MSDIVPASSNQLDNWNDSGPWYEGTHGERIAYDSPVSIRTARMRSLNPLQPRLRHADAYSSQPGGAFCRHRG
jgi:hypothetical protein